MSKDDCSPVEDGQTVTIPLAEYRGLMEDRSELLRLRGVGGNAICRNPRSRFRRDWEVIAFLNEHATTATVQWLTDELQRQFGKERAPSRSAVGRYVRRVRLQLGIGEVRQQRTVRETQ
ncbi:hypothetical protein CCR80_06835 [Rhodothalassium salexigens]|uniref:hypothetical protein n=1 Tax=Rhodothalassium salexigens TaxID=1086 RepID=UPI0019147EAF|nr:hypothetical protein [Rhodothalassium salexigens]MBK5920749.1 hypothetical protein [Rhodothalassium salexigens]